MTTLFRRLVREDAGQDLIEYGLLIGIITVAAITAVTAIGPKVTSYFSDLNANLPQQAEAVKAMDRRAAAMSLRGLFTRFLREDSAQDLIEYALLTGIVTVGSIVVLEAIRTNMATVYSRWESNGQANWIPDPPSQTEDGRRRPKTEDRRRKTECL